MDPSQIVDIAVSVVLGLVMFGIGLSITVEEFVRLIKNPKGFFAALIAQIIGLPIIALLINLIAPIPAELKVGFIILAASPGGATSGFLTYWWRGNVALSLSLTSVNSFIVLFTIPIVVNLGLGVFLGQTTELQLPFWQTVQQIFVITIIPAVLGVLIRYRFPIASDKIRIPAKYTMLALLAIVFAIKMFAGENQGGAGLTVQDFLVITPVALIQNASCLFFGYYLMRTLRRPHPTRLTAAIEYGVQNTTLAFLIASSLLGNQDMIKPALIYSLYSFWTASLFAYLSNRLAEKASREMMRNRNK